MIELITNYWLQTLLGLIAGGLGFLCKKFWSLYKAEQKHQKSEEQKNFYQDIKDAIAEQGEQSLAGDKILQDQIDIMKQGLLTVQRKSFMEECHNLLKEEHTITLEEFEIIGQDYEAYKKLGGNGQGATLYAMVQKKATNNITDK